MEPNPVLLFVDQKWSENSKLKDRKMATGSRTAAELIWKMLSGRSQPVWGSWVVPGSEVRPAGPNEDQLSFKITTIWGLFPNKALKIWFQKPGYM